MTSNRKLNDMKELEFQRLPLVDKWDSYLEVAKTVNWMPKESYPNFNYLTFMQQMKHIETNWEIISFAVPTPQEFIIQEYQGTGPVILRVVSGVSTIEPRFIVRKKKRKQTPSYKYLGFQRPEINDWVPFVSLSAPDSALVRGEMIRCTETIHNIVHCFRLIDNTGGDDA